MRTFDTGKVQDKLINRLERKEKRESFQRDRFFKFKLPEIHTNLSQMILMKKIIETDTPAAVSDLLLKGLKQALKINEFDFKYFIAPIRDVVSRPDPISLYMTQFILEVAINDPAVIEVYGTDLDIYQVINDVVTRINTRFERTEKEIIDQLSRNKSVSPGSRDYDIALDQLFRKRMGEPQG
ncbi:MAG: hypothetical protein MUO52_00735 [Desulfobacterales bacterium]|nr:hypothetical protein [Desulfobacterales bacterium]